MIEKTPRLKNTSVRLKIASGVVGLLASLAWLGSAVSPGIAGFWLNALAAALTALATAAQAASSLIDWKVAPSATFD